MLASRIVSFSLVITLSLLFSGCILGGKKTQEAPVVEEATPTPTPQKPRPKPKPKVTPKPTPVSIPTPKPSPTPISEPPPISEPSPEPLDVESLELGEEGARKPIQL